MKQTVQLIAAPTAMQPGGYMVGAYLDRVNPGTKTVELEVDRQNKQWSITLNWECPRPVSSAKEDTNLFVDAAALMVPSDPNSPWATMGDDSKPVEAVLWRADRDKLTRLDMKGFGSANRQDAPGSWHVQSNWNGGIWTVQFNIDQWPVLAKQQQLSVAIWRGESQDRGGLKSVSPGWITL